MTTADPNALLRALLGPLAFPISPRPFHSHTCKNGTGAAQLLHYPLTACVENRDLVESSRLCVWSHGTAALGGLSRVHVFSHVSTLQLLAKLISLVI